VRVEEGLVVATVVEESAAAVEEERAVTETTARQAALEPPAGAGSGGGDVMMVPADDGSAPLPLARERDIVTSVAPEPSAAVTASSIEGAADTSSSQYRDH
jgi:hypothetical protein